jgi:hypothetical protein
MPWQRCGSWLLPADTLGRFYLRAKPERKAAWGSVHTTSEIRRVIKETF